jgi:hypothetical protein
LAKRRLRKDAERAKNRERYWRNRVRKPRLKRTPEDKAEKRRQYYLANKEVYNRKRREYYLKHKDQEIAKNKEYKDKNPELVRQRQRDYEIRNKERLQFERATRKRKREQADPAVRLRARVRARLSSAIIEALATKSDVSANLTGCSIQELMAYIETKFYGGMSWDDYGKGYGHFQIDHIKPCCSFDFTDPAQQRECFRYTNLQPLWYVDHMKKTQQDIARCKETR